MVIKPIHSWMIVSSSSRPRTRPRSREQPIREVHHFSSSPLSTADTRVSTSTSNASIIHTTAENKNTSSSSSIPSYDNYSNRLEEKENNSYDDDENDDEEEIEARSEFGTKKYWDDMYQGRGDFPMDEYKWYFGFDKYSKLIDLYATGVATTEPSSNEHKKKNRTNKDVEILIPGIGNDPILLDLLQKGYTQLTATDYSRHAIKRQQDILSYKGYAYNDCSETDDDDDDDNDIPLQKKKKWKKKNDNNDGNSRSKQKQPKVMLHQMDARKMPKEWTNKFDIIIEKGVLDAIYLAGDGNIEKASKEFGRVLKNPDGNNNGDDASMMRGGEEEEEEERGGGILISISGVVPMKLRKEIFDDPKEKNWIWIRDGSNDLEAGLFVLQKLSMN